jgi:Tfp pilus assembly protein PilX
MPIKRQLVKQIKKISQNIRQSRFAIKKQRVWLLKIFLINSKQKKSRNSGFVLPTVVMVSLVVVLLTTAIMFRSFERAKNASNVRVNEAVINAATPALDRAKTKLNKLFSDSRLPRATPTDTALVSHFAAYNNEYTFGDEQQIKVQLSTADQNKLTTAEKSKLTTGSTATDQEKTYLTQLQSAWMYPVDTDNNGKYDTYTMYGIYFKNPPVTNGAYERSRNPLEARTIPMMGGNVGSNCGNVAGTSATLVGNSGWFKVGNQLKKSFFVYTANVPIINPPNTTNYETYKGNKGFSALEYQQERVQLPLVNNAVVYEDDLVLTPSEDLNLNGRIITNSNFATGGNGPDGTYLGSTVRLYQVSSQDSCFYEVDNSKIFVAGNLAAGGYTDGSDRANGTQVHLYKGKGVTPETGSSYNIKTHKSVTQEPRSILYNSLAYTERINRLVEAQTANDATSDPDEVKQGITKAKLALGLSSYTATEEAQLRNQQLTLYFKKRTRRVPYEEVAFNGNALKVGSGPNYASTGTTPVSPLNGSGNTLRPPDEWIYPFSPTNGSSKTGTVGSNTVTFSNLDLNTNSSNKLYPSATEPQRLQKVLQGAEQSVGDRISVGNNLPELWWNGTKFLSSSEENTQNISSRYWDNPDNTNSDNIRTRSSQIQELPNLGNIVRDGDWEIAAAQVPSTPLEPVGGLRVVTGAGVYLPDGFTTTSTSFTAASKEIWSDQKPVPQATAPTSTTIKPYWMYAYTEGATNYANITHKYDTVTTPTVTPYLRMRATAVYHYKRTNYDQSSPTPIACVSSFYVPTNSTTAKNASTLPDTVLVDGIGRGADGKSNNGIVYGAPSGTTTTYATALGYISDLKYSNGRFIDDGLLKRALAKTAANRTLSEKSAIDAQICALQILDGTITVAGTPPIPHGAIRETTFLDARQIKTIHTSTSTTDFNLNKKDREPLEIRATILDIEQLRTTTIGSGPASTQEYLLPNSGIIYASRDDALPDWSAVTDYTAPTESQKRISSVDHKLDPNRRPNGIVLVNGRKLWRDDDYRDAEKGLILASNLPVYIRGEFNRHGDFSATGVQEEFTETLTSTWNNFYSRTKAQLNPNFACRKTDSRLPNCTVGDEWRPAAVLADAMTILSDNYRFGFRHEGDYDWKPDASTITGSLATDFSTINSYVPVAKWRDTSTNLPKDWDSTKTGFQGSSYLNNFVTPVALQIPSGTYFTEMCTATNVSDCTNPVNWKMTNQCGNGNGQTYTVTSQNVIGDNVNTGSNKIKTGTILDDPATFESCIGTSNAAGISTSPRRLLFVRETTSPYNLATPLKVLGIDVDDKIQKFTLGSTISDAGTQLKSPSSDAFMPWLKTVTSGSTVTLKPVLQLDQPFATPADPNNVTEITGTTHGNWLQTAASTSFNLIIAAGDVPGRPNENGGGLHNFPRLLENWEPGTSQTTRISGSFMQLGRSAYATAPFFVTLDSTNTYKNNNTSGKLPYYRSPIRQWGYDVGLLSQSPDAFALKLVRIPKDKPDEYYREVGRDDTWVQSLLCAKNVDGDTDASNDIYVIATSQRPSSICP